jgi:3-methyladenine DNA glycosylase/8-oxoguanine DNA glycosylase
VRKALPFDPEEAVRHVAARDKRLARLIERVGPLGLRVYRQNPFEALSESIVYQQLAGRAVRAIFGRMVRLFHPRRFPRPEDLLEIPEERLRGQVYRRARSPRCATSPRRPSTAPCRR